MGNQKEAPETDERFLDVVRHFLTTSKDDVDKKPARKGTRKASKKASPAKRKPAAK